MVLPKVINAHDQHLKKKMNPIKEWRNRILCGDAYDKLQELPDDSIDLIATDPQYGWSFMGKDWDKALPRQGIYDECFRVLKPGAFMFWMSGARLDGLIENGIRIRNAGFKTDFTPIWWAYATGFPKAQNISKTIDKRACKKELTETLGRKPTKEEFEEAWKGFRDVVGENPYNKRRPNPPISERYKQAGWQSMITVPTTEEAKVLDGSYAGFQPKPAVEVIIVAMKPLSEKTYVEQALKSGKGITWLDACRIGSETRKSNVNDFTNIHSNKYGSGAKIPTTGYKEVQGRFPANLLCEDAVLGSFSRFFSLDAWFEEKLKQLPKELQKAFPFLIVPKASKSERNSGCEGLPFGSPPGSKRCKPALGRTSALGKPRQNFHPTVKPLKLMSYLITLGSREGDLILDPFIGSGTTAIACKMLNRNFIGFEIDPEYVTIANARLSKEKKTLKMKTTKMEGCE